MIPVSVCKLCLTGKETRIVVVVFIIIIFIIIINNNNIIICSAPITKLYIDAIQMTITRQREVKRLNDVKIPGYNFPARSSDEEVTGKSL